MESLKATIASEITRESVTEAETLVVNGFSVSKPPQHRMQAGDFHFRPTVIQHVVTAPWYRRWFFGEKTHVKYDTLSCIIISCPVCGLPILTGQVHRVTQRAPLTINGEIACP